MIAVNVVRYNNNLFNYDVPLQCIFIYRILQLKQNITPYFCFLVRIKRSNLFLELGRYWSLVYKLLLSVVQPKSLIKSFKPVLVGNAAAGLLATTNGFVKPVKFSNPFNEVDTSPCFS